MSSIIRSRVWAVVVAALLLCGCALKPVSVTGKEGSGQQSETAFAVNRVGDNTTLTVTCNDGTDQSAIQFTPTTRITKKGATHLGWSSSSAMSTSPPWRCPRPSSTPRRAAKSVAR